jgi:hypothetical protein
VQVFYAPPDLKYDRVCEIDTTVGLEDLITIFQREVRKCGADGVIMSGNYHDGTPYYGEWIFHGTGIRINGQTAIFTTRDKKSAFSLGIQAHDLAKVREVLSSVPRRRQARAPSDDQVVDLGLYIATLDGLNCDASIVELLEKEYEAVFPKFNAVSFYIADHNDSNTPLCADVVARSLARMTDLPTAVLEIHNHYVEQLNRPYDHNLDTKVGKYNSLLKEASRMIVNACKLSSIDPTCMLKNPYLNLANRTKAVKSVLLSKNANDVFEILER